jgi:quercetin dioxygenase-like cupin family protein
VISREGYKGFFHLGGPIEGKGRLRYIDGCTDSLLIPPVLRGDACFNLLYFPPSIQQTTHTHPSIRAGIVARGRGVCKTPQGDISLVAGMIFLLDPDAPHGFWTEQDSMTVIAYHPDSDFGPQHDDHPMLNRTIVDGTSARYRPDIQTPFQTERPS